MSNNATFSHICEVWQPENCTSPEHPAPYNEFLIETYITFMFVSTSINEEEVENSVTTPTAYNSFRQKRDHLVQDTTSWSTISNMLSQVNVPYHVQPFMIGKISKAARSIGGALENANRRSIPMVVLIRVVVQVSDLESLLMDSDTEEDEEESEKGVCFNGLGKVKVEEADSGNSNTYLCVICLEEILVGTEAVSMPCSHVYHGDCLVEWLERSELCPLCRFQMLAGSSGSKG